MLLFWGTELGHGIAALSNPARIYLLAMAWYGKAKEGVVEGHESEFIRQWRGRGKKRLYAASRARPFLVRLFTEFNGPLRGAAGRGQPLTPGFQLQRPTAALVTEGGYPQAEAMSPR